MTASCMTCIYSQLTKEQYPCSECYYGNSGNPSKHEPVVEAPDINVGNMDTTTHDSIPAETGKNDGDGTSGDCISRTQAIEVLRNRWLKTRNYEGIGEDIAEECEIYLKTLPSVQPEIIYCKDCKFYTAYDYTGKLMCKRIGKGMILPKPEDYCSYAERITDGKPD